MSFDLDVVLYHEAGHVLGCLVFGIPMDYVKLDYGLLGGLSGGHVELSTEDGHGPRNNITMTLAGAAAEAAWNKRHGRGWHYDEDGSAFDLALARELMRKHHIPERPAWAAAERLVMHTWSRIEGVAEALRERRRLAQAAAKKASKV